MTQAGDQTGDSFTDDPPSDPAMRIETIATQHKEISGTVRRTMLTLLGLELYCVVATFGISDVELVVSNSKISMPVSGAKMSATGFMIAAPLILAVIVTYMHVFYGRLLVLNRRIHSDPVLADAARSGTLIKAPSLFNFEGAFPVFLTSFIFYWSCPIVLAAITFTLATPFSDYFRLLINITVLVSAGFLLLAFSRRGVPSRRDRPGWFYGTIFLGRGLAIALVLLLVVASFIGESFTRSLNLERIDLSNQILRDRQLPGANLRDAKMANSDLSGADLRGANLRGANLNKARLRGADLSGADLTGVNLKGADLTAANLSGAKLNGARLETAKLGKAIVIGADLSRAELIRVDFSGADLTTAILSGANLYGSKFKGAILRGAALDTVKYFRQQQILSAAPSAPPTALPDALTWPFVEKDGKWVKPEN